MEDEVVLDLAEAETIIVGDEEGHNVEYKILFTFENDETGKQYVLYYDESEEEPEVMYKAYDDEGNLYPVTTTEEMDMIEEVFNTFMLEEE